MNIEKLLENRKINKNKLLEYGFIKKDNLYYYKNTLLENEFNIIVTYKNNKLNTKIIDINTNEEYILLQISSIDGEYIGKVREAYNEKIKDIIEKCSSLEVFKNKQTKDIIKYIKEKYNEELEFLWEKKDTAVFRHKDTKKWYLVLMSISKEKLGLSKNEVVDIINLKLPPEQIEDLVDNKLYFKGYHMNKKHWITIILDNNINIKDLKKYIDISYNITL